MSRMLDHRQSSPLNAQARARSLLGREAPAVLAIAVLLGVWTLLVVAP